MKSEKMTHLWIDLKKAFQQASMIFTVVIIVAALFTNVNNEYIFAIAKVLLLVNFISIVIPFLLSLFIKNHPMK